MSQAPLHEEDPIQPTLLMAGAFAILCAIRLTALPHPYFDEVHYLPAAREILSGGDYINREHPLLGKTIMAAGISVFGDNPWGWRVFSLLAGVITLVASMRAMWHATRTRFASLAFGLLLASGFILLVQSRIAMLDIYMACFLSLAAWQFSAAIRRPEQGRLRLATTGLFLGLAMGAKWSAVPVAMLPGLVFFFARLSAGRRRFFTSQRGIPIPGISLLEAFLWLGVVPLIVYWATFAPAYFLVDNTLGRDGIFAMHKEMLALQTQILAPHNYQSNWPEWVTNTRGIWYFFEPVDGLHRGVLLIGNPFTMLLGLPALTWCLLTGISKRNWPALAMAIGYIASLGLWLFATKSVQFYFHYFVPHFFLLGALALALEEYWRSGAKWVSIGALAISLGVFAWFYPALTAAAFNDPMDFLNYAWLEGWR
ncbi:putative dolichyl-phosphate-mannose--protein mannosyltransferase [Altererythrobacter insulae]|nr:putative dolichyl-phosphate-mannose--protein mannosyltransferase [Altererythrobacter insulae]